MKLKKIIPVLGAAAIALWSFNMGTAAAQVDLEKGVIVCKGVGSAPPNSITASYGKTFARQAARLDAMRNIAEEAGGIDVESKEDKEKQPDGTYIVKHDYIKTILRREYVKNNLKNARQIGKTRYLPDGGCEVTMEMKLSPDLLTKLRKESKKQKK